jgi:CDP-diacylglycerol--serine O-phosphatidyltransferase
MLPIVLVFGIVMYNLPIGILAVSTVYALSGPISMMISRKNQNKAASSV